MLFILLQIRLKLSIQSTTSVRSCYKNIANKADELLATAVGLVSNFHSRPFHTASGEIRQGRAVGERGGELKK